MNDNLKIGLGFTVIIICMGSAFCLLFILGSSLRPSGTETIIGTVKQLQVDKNEITIILDSQNFTYHTYNDEQQQVPLIIGDKYQFDLSIHELLGTSWFTLKSVTKLED